MLIGSPDLPDDSEEGYDGDGFGLAIGDVDGCFYTDFIGYYAGSGRNTFNEVTGAGTGHIVGNPIGEGASSSFYRIT